MHYFSAQFFKNRQEMGALRFQRHFTFDFGDLKLRDLAKLWIF